MSRNLAKRLVLESGTRKRDKAKARVGAQAGAKKRFAAGKTSAQSCRALRVCIAMGLSIVLACALDMPLGMVQGILQVDQAVGDESLPVWFGEELFSLDGFEGVRVASGGAVVGFEMDGSAAQSFEAITELMEEKGWRCLQSGLEGSASFVKEAGLCRWAWVSCVEVAGSTSVVVQCEPVA